jgi:hypothetical protein
MQGSGMTVSLKPRPQGAAIRVSDTDNLWRCQNPLSLTCTHHGDRIEVPCGRWRKCKPCARRLQYRLRLRFLAGIEQVPAGRQAMFLTLTFPADQAPDETEAQRCWRSLTRRLRHRDLLGEYGFVLQRTKRGTLHFHGIAHMPWMSDDLVEWRALLTASGFGVQNKLVVAAPSHAGYVTRYISTRLAELAPLRRAYSFSRGFPQPQSVKDSKETKRLLDELGAKSECSWELSGAINASLRR